LSPRRVELVAEPRVFGIEWYGFEFGFGVTAKYADNAAPSPSKRQRQQQTQNTSHPTKGEVRQAGYINGQIKITT